MLRGCRVLQAGCESHLVRVRALQRRRVVLQESPQVTQITRRTISLPPEATTRTCHLPSMRVPKLEESRVKIRVWRTSLGALFFPLGDDETVISSLEAVLACRLVLRAVIPSFRVFVSEEFENNDFFECGAFQNFMTPVEGAKNNRVLLKAGRRHLFILGHLLCVTSSFARDHHVSGHFFSSAASSGSDRNYASKFHVEATRFSAWPVPQRNLAA